MLILHVSVSSGSPALLWIWGELGSTDRQGALLPRRFGNWLPAEHPCGCDRKCLRSSISQGVMAVGGWEQRVAWLPSDAEGPLPSDDRIVPLAGRQAARLTSWYIDTLALAPASLHDVLLDCQRQESAEWEFGADVAFWRRLHELAASLVVRQQYLPGVMEIKKHYRFASWYPVFEREDLQRLERLADAMPLAARAVSDSVCRPPVSTPRLSVEYAVEQVVNSMVKEALNQSTDEERKPASGKRWQDRPVDERWVEALLSNGPIHTDRRTFSDLTLRIAAWREPLDHRPRLESDTETVPLGLPAVGEGFWECRNLPDPIGCPEMSDRSAAVLERVGPFPNWRGERPLRDTLEPVYDAASRYALEHVFGRKLEPPLHPLERRR